MQNINFFLELDDLAKKDGARYPKKREIYTTLLSEKGKHFTCIVGPRGVGKTILLKQLALSEKDSFYLSLDSLEDSSLFDLAKTLIEKYNIKLLLLDEIHFQKDYNKQLKLLFDFFNVKIVFTSSVSLSLFKSSYDLSRRIKLINLPPFSFREYLYFTKDLSIRQVALDDIINNTYDETLLRYEYLFEDYLKGGLMPFSLEEPDIMPLISNIREKIFTTDMPSVARLTIDELKTLEKVLRFVGTSPVEGINYSSISRNIGITKYKAEIYLKLFEQAFILNIIFPAGTNVLREPKVVMCLPWRLLYKEFSQAIGAIREDFFVETARMQNIPLHYLKSKRGAKTPDYLITIDNEDCIVEVGGKGKGREQFKGITLKKKVIFTHPAVIQGIKRPLFLLGFI